MPGAHVSTGPADEGHQLGWVASVQPDPPGYTSVCQGEGFVVDVQQAKE